jgi:hypothetical protein
MIAASDPAIPTWLYLIPAAVALASVVRVLVMTKRNPSLMARYRAALTDRKAIGIGAAAGVVIGAVTIAAGSLVGGVIYGLFIGLVVTTLTGWKLTQANSSDDGC